MRLAYADPPYLGCCGLYGHRHEEPFGCWDRPEAHGRLMEDLTMEFDGWALSVSSPSLAEIIPRANDIAEFRIASWVKPFAAYKRNVRIAYTWEPVLFKPGRNSSKDGAVMDRTLAQGRML